MPDAPADALARHLLSRLPPEQPHARADLARLPLPVAHYLGGVLDRRLAREAALPASGWFDGEAEAVQAAARAWRAATHDTARFPAEAWAEAIDDAARQVLGYLVEPVEALTERVFADTGAALPLEAVHARMATFSPYPYLREIAEGYFARKGVEAVGRDDFERLLRRIDRRMVSLFGPSDWLALLEPLFALLRPLPDGGRVPAALLRRFFEAKGYDDLARALDAEAYDETALRGTLTAALPDLDETEAPAAEAATAAAAPAPGPEAAPGPSPEPVREVAPEATAPEATAPEEEVPEPVAQAPEPDELEPEDPGVEEEPAVEEVEADAPAAREAPPLPTAPEAEPQPASPDAQLETEGVEPLWLRLARQREEAAQDAPEPPVPEPAAHTPQPEDEPEPEPLWKRFTAGTSATAPSAASAAPASARPPEPLARLETRVLGPSATERRDWYVAHLTGGSEADYRAVLEQLDAAPSWTAASQVIAREVFRKHQVNIYSDAAIAFTDAAEARFARAR